MGGLGLGPLKDSGLRHVVRLGVTGIAVALPQVVATLRVLPFSFRGPHGATESQILAFALHPLQTESVAYISGRRDVLFAAFYLAALLLYLRRRPNRGWLTAFGTAFDQAGGGVRNLNRFLVDGVDYRGRFVSDLVEPISVTWDYGEPIFYENVSIIHRKCVSSSGHLKVTRRIHEEGSYSISNLKVSCI